MTVANPWEMEWGGDSPSAGPWEMNFGPAPAAKAAPAPATQAQQLQALQNQQYKGPLRPLGLTLSTLAEVPANLLGIPGGIERLANQYIENPIRGAMGLPPATGFSLPTSHDILSHTTDPLGITGRPDLQPANLAEHLSTAALRGGTGGALLSRLGGGGALSMGTLGAGSDLAGEATRQALGPDVNPLIPAGVSLLTSLAGSRPAAILDAKMGASAAQKGVDEANTALTAAQEAERAALRATPGAKGQLATATRDSIAAAKAEQARVMTQADQDLSSRSLSADAVVAQRRQNLTGLPVPLDSETAGRSIQDIARHWFNNIFPTLRERAWEPLDAVVDGNTSVNPGMTMGRLQSMVRRASSPEMQQVFDQLQTSLPRDLYRRLTREITEEHPVTGEMVGTGQRVQDTMTWNDARGLRSLLGDALAQHGLVKDATQKQISDLYAAITSDMRETARGLPDVMRNGQAVNPAELFDAANAESTRLHQFVQNNLSKIIDHSGAKNEILAEKVLPNILTSARSGSGHVEPLITNLGPDFQNQLLAAHLSPAPVSGKGLPTWDQMSAPAKAVMIPDANERAVLDAAFRARAEAKAEHGQVAQLADTRFKETKLRLEEADRAARNTISSNLSEARWAREDAAKAQATAAKNATLSLADKAAAVASMAGGGLGHMWLGHDIATLGSHWIPGLTNLEAGAAGSVAAAMAPWAIRNTVGALASPRLWPYIATGAPGAMENLGTLGQTSSPTAFDLGASPGR